MLSKFKKTISLIATFLMLGNFAVRAYIVVASAGPRSGGLEVFGERLI